MVSGLIGGPNLGIETRISRKSSVQLDVLGSFWNSFLEKPLHIVQVFPEYRYYPKGKFEKFYLGTHIGFGMFTISKYGKSSDSYQSGRNTYYGITVGYKKKLNSNFKIDFFIGGGSSQATYRGYSKITRRRTDIKESESRNFNGSGEWLPYRGGIMLVYSLN